MHKFFIFSFIYCFSVIGYTQSDTEVHLFDINQNGNILELTNHLNISNSKGYDNQPSFWNDTTILFAATRNNQTDIKLYDSNTKQSKWLNSSPLGSEYSPTRIPGQKNISSIRLDKDGKQLLYKYDYKKGTSTPIIKDLVIGYHSWFSKDLIVSFVLGDESSLVVSNLKDNSNTTVTKNIGRSLHKIPNSNLISYISKEKKQWEIRSLNPVTLATKLITYTIPNVEDMCWTPKGTILMANGQVILEYDPKTNTSWEVFAHIIDKNIHSISRLAMNSAGSKLALVAEVSPEIIVQKQLDAYNARDIDAFINTYAKDIKIYEYPNALIFDGIESVKTSYTSFFKNTTDLHSEVKNRIIQGNKVIDEEIVTSNGQLFGATAIYEVKNGKITKVTFIR